MEVKLGVTKFGWRRTLSLSVMPLMRQNEPTAQPRMVVRSAGTPRETQSALWRAQS